MGHVCCLGMIMSLCLVFYVFFCKPMDVVEGIHSGPAVLMEVSAKSESVVADFLARSSACSLPIIPAWDFTMKKWIGDGDWRITLAMD